jgi:hypothetical protein
VDSPQGPAPRAPYHPKSTPPVVPIPLDAPCW